MTSLQDKSRGAALIVAILVLAILLIIVLSFFQASRQEMSIATNYRNATQADLLAEGGTSIAIAFLNHDRAIHPTVTSIDHAWKTYFNGAWAVGKPWLWKYGTGVNTVKGEGNAVPQFDLDNWIATYSLPPIDGLLYIPRVDLAAIADPNLYNPTANPFAINYPGFDPTIPGNGSPLAALSSDPYWTNTDPTLSRLGPDQVNRFADWDNDEDGLRDSAWIPMPMDVFPDMPADEPGDGIDNDLDGVVDESVPNGIDDDGDGIIDNEPAERALFLYWGGDDGLDNDGDTEIDEPDEQRPFLTTPFVPVFLEENGVVVVDIATYPNFPAQAFNPNTGAVETFTINPNRRSASNPDSSVDILDNDYNLVINDSVGSAYRLIDAANPSYTPEQRENENRLRQASGYHPIHPSYLPSLPANTVISFSGEPVCELVGRAAILVKDENSKVNMNAAGGRNYRDVASPYVQTTLPTGGLRRALWNGASTAEYETGVLPQVGFALRDRFWNLRTGAHAGIGFKSVGAYGDIVPDDLSYATIPYNFDVSLPGFGRVDDNGNALWMAMDGIDNDGDGLVDEGLADLNGDGVLNDGTVAGTPNEAWNFEGVDEPQEFQMYRPYRNKSMFPYVGHPTAEEDGLDNADAVDDTLDHATDASIDEIGELGDRYLRSTEQLKLAETFIGADFDKNRSLVTVNGTDVNSRFQRRLDLAGNLLERPTLSGPKLDYNYATTQQIFNAIRNDWSYIATPPTGPADGGEIQAFARGLRREDTAISAANIFGFTSALGGASNNGAIPAFPPDMELRAAQLAANIRDMRDTNLGRTTVTTTIQDKWSDGRIENGPRFISYTQGGLENIRINEIMARPVRRVEAEMDTSLLAFNPNAFSGNVTDPDFQVQVEQLDATLAQVGVGPTTAPWARTGTVIGERAGVTTTSLTVDPADPTSESTVIQFRFRPSPGLPPSQFDPATVTTPRRIGGRYYLMLNSTLTDAVTGRLEPTIIGSAIDPAISENIEYTFKYATATEQDILTDITDGTTDGLTIPWKDSARVGYRNMGGMAPGTETGMVFLPSDPTFDDAASAGYGDNESYTVHIPPYDTVNPANQYYLYVAIRFTLPVDPANPLLSINYFDFSQEPDHEWIEVVNTATSGNSVNLGGWQLEVGTNGAVRDDATSATSALFTVPSNTTIAPGGSLLLGFDKYDDGARTFVADAGLVKRNGIGLTRVLDSANSMYMTEPPIPGWLLNVTQGSVFARNAADPDFIDWDGNAVDDPDDLGLTGPPRYQFDTNNDGTLDLFTDVADRGVISSFTDELGLAGPNKAFDRIVELQVDQPAALETIDSLPELAEVVLNGGLLPNYPEHDGIDNDGDNATLIADRVDNDGDGGIDEQVLALGDTLDNDNDGLVDEVGETNDPFDQRPEGIDEGRWEFMLDAAAPPVPLWQRGSNPPGSYSEGTLAYVYALSDGSNSGPVYLPYVGAGTDVNVVTPSATALPDPPEWKAFVERRWYTPDNVPVTLYAGSKVNGLVADRVTYSERDVVNRATDDIVSTDLDADGNPDRVPLNEFCLSFWPDNTMGVDFYRSIERKHPMYNGDLHGLSNRWQATDGAYDDWSPSTGIFETLAGAPQRRLYDTTGALIPGWELYWHAFSGSPLRMSLSQRMMENPGNQFGANDASNRRWAYEKARDGFRNGTFTSPGDLVSLTSFMDLREPAAQPVVETNAIAFDDVPINYAQVGPAPHMDTSVRGVLLAQHPYDNLFQRDDLAAVTAGVAMDPVVLAAGTANFYTVTPQPVDWNTMNSGGWDGTIAGTTPQPWTPVFLFPFMDGVTNLDLAPYPSPPYLANSFPLDADSRANYSMGGTPINYLFTGPYGGTMTNTAAFDPAALPAADMVARWPLKLRTVMYASQNIAGFDVAKPHDDPLNPNPAATALFEWDGADGLENGDYDVYIMTADDLTQVAAAEYASRTNQSDPTTGRYLTTFGRNLLLSTSGTDPDEMIFDVEMFTDRNYVGGSNEPYGPNGKCWIDGYGGNPVDQYPQPGEFERNSGVITAPMNEYNPGGDSFGMLLGKSPDENGVMYYGTVRVENNYLALLLRNWTENDELARFSRVILTPRPRTHGKLNINTVESTLAEFPAQHEFNPLVGTPGMLAAYDATTAQRFSYFNEGDLGPLDADYLAALTLSDNIVGNRQHFDSETGVLPVRYHSDGRYYENPSDMVSQHPNERPTQDNMNSYPNWFQLSGTNTAEQYEEMMGRYTRLANLVTTRSDVFEITVTAQTGYLSSEDLNGDGRIDYRNDFIVTGEKKIRTVYER